MRLTEQTEQEPSPRGAITLLHQGCWQHLPIGTIERLAVGGRPTECAAGYTVYSEADAEALAVITRGLVRVYMHGYPSVSMVPLLVSVQAMELAWVGLNYLGVERTTTEPAVRSVADIHL